jgi:hypothetical protein
MDAKVNFWKIFADICNVSEIRAFFPKKLLNLLVVLDDFFFHLKLLYLFLIHPVYCVQAGRVFISL